MSSTLIAGRVDSDVAKRTQFFIEKNGTTQADVIRHIWKQISDTGVVPIDNAKDTCTQKDSFEELKALKEIKPKSDYLKKLTPQDLKKELAKRG